MKNINLKIILKNSFFFLFSFILTATVFVFIYELIGVNWDTSLLIDGAYRVSKGELPTTDFLTPFAQLIFVFASFGLNLFPQTMFGFNLGLIFLSLVLSLIGYRSISLSYNFDNYYKIIFGTIFLILIFPKSMSYGFTWSHVGIYNRFGYGILSIIVVTLTPFVFKKTFKKEPLIWCGLLIACLFYLKITFFIVALLFLPLLIIFRVDKIYSLILISSILIFTFIFGGIIGWDFLSFYNDLKYLYYISTDGVFKNKIYKISEFFHPFSFISWFLMIYLTIKDTSKIKDKLIFIFLALYCLGADLVLNYTINQPYQNMMAIIMSLYLIGSGHLSIIFKDLDFFVDKNRKVRTSSLPKLFLSLIVVYHITLHFHLYTYFFLNNIPAVITKIKTFDIQKKYISNIYKELPKEVKKIIKSDSKIIVVGHNDDISFSLSLKSPALPVLYWHEGQTFSKNSIKIDKRFKANNLFKQVDIVILKTKGVHSISSKSFKNMYSKYLKKYFTILSAEKNFTVYIKLK